MSSKKFGHRQKHQNKSALNKYQPPDQHLSKKDVFIDDNNEIDDGKVKTISVKVYLWEFGQNNPKRDSGSKLHRLGYSRQLRIGQSFPGVVLSSEAHIYCSPKDRELVMNYGIAGINCSWNRLEEIPFDSLGKGRNQRILPILYAVNTVNYGKPYKMNTAEAIAACLFITGFEEDARNLMYPFSYGEEFFKLNNEALQLYSQSTSSEEVESIHYEYMQLIEQKKINKEVKKQEEVESVRQHYSKLMASSGTNQSTGGIIGGYMDDMDLPPMDDYDDEEEEEEEGDEIENAGEYGIVKDVGTTDSIEKSII